MRLSNKWLWWGAGVILIILGLASKPMSPPSNQVMNLPASPTLPQTAEQTAVPSAVLVVPTEVVAVEMTAAVDTSAIATAESTACPLSQPVPEGAPVWLTINGHTFAGVPGRVFPTGMKLTGRQIRDYCETTQFGPFGPEWVQVP